MKKHIESLKKSPPEVQKKVIHLMSLIVTGVIVLLWLVLRFTVLPNKSYEPLIDYESANQIVDRIGTEFQLVEQTISTEKDAFTEAKEQREQNLEQLIEEDPETDVDIR